MLIKLSELQDKDQKSYWKLLLLVNTLQKETRDDFKLEVDAKEHFHHFRKLNTNKEGEPDEAFLKDLEILESKIYQSRNWI